MRPAGQIAEVWLEIRGLIQIFHALVPNPAIVCSPRFRLAHDLIGFHDCFRGQESKEAELCEPAEEQARSWGEAFEPAARDQMVDVPLVGEGDPDIDVREKK